MPSQLVPSTTMSGKPYPLAEILTRQSIPALRETPDLLAPVVGLLNKHSARISEAAYQSCKEALPDKYYHRKNPVRMLWPMGYTQGYTYARLIPSNRGYCDSHATILNLKKDCR